MTNNSSLWHSLPLKFSFRKSVPVMLQSEATECGLVCLAMVAAYHGKDSNVLSLRQNFGVSSRGATLEQLSLIATNLGMGFRALSLELDEIYKLQLPCIIHWDFNHFVVLTHIKKNKVVLHDPAIGQRVITLDTFSKKFTGIAVELWPEIGFIKQTLKIAIHSRELLKNITGFKPALIKVFLLSIVIESISLLIPVGTQLVMDHAIPATDFGLLELICIGLFILTLLQTAISCWRSWTVMVIDTCTDVQWKDSLFHHLIRLPLDWFDKRKVGDIQSRFSSLDFIRQTCVHDITGCIINIIMSVGAFIMMVIYGNWLTIVVFGFTVLYILLRIFTYSRYRQLSEESIVKHANASSYLTETLYGIATIRAQGLTEQRRIHRTALLMEAESASINIEKFDMLFQVLSVFLNACDNLLILWLGIGQVMDRQMTIGAFVAFGIFRAMFSERMLSLTDILLTLKIQSLHKERVADIALTPSETHVQLKSFFNIEQALSIEIKNVSYRYDKYSPNIIDELSLEIQAGENIAIIGASGCGKSTLLKLLSGLIPPDSGQINVSGLDIHAVGISNYRTRVSCILQEDRLLAGTIRENISGFAEHIDEELMIECAKISNIHNEIINLTMGYESLVGELGDGLSGGQKQRIFIARALYRKPGILFMDEATSHLDETNEKLINDAISGLNMTRIIIAHRTSTIASADRVIKL